MRFQHIKLALTTLSLGLVLSAISATVWADSYDRKVSVSNNTSLEIYEFYGSNTGTNDWQEDILGDYTIPAGESADINFNDNTGYCMFDFLIVFEDESEMIEERFNVCDYSELTITD